MNLYSSRGDGRGRLYAVAQARRLLSGLIVGLSYIILSTRLCHAQVSTDLKVSIGSFPYDLTVEAVTRVASILRDNTNVYTVHLDHGLPWAEALSGATFDRDVLDQWQRHKQTITSNQQVYLAIAPLAEDRMSWATGPSGRAAPVWAKEDSALNPTLRSAYSKYVLRAVAYFKPTYLNIGVEAGDMAAKRPKKWPQFEALFLSVAEDVRREFPGVKIGISVGLPLLMEAGVLERAQRLIDASDYLGLSFYPYMSNFYQKLGASPLPAVPEQWRTPLQWAAQHVRKPLAMCETAYSSEPVTLPKFSLSLPGDPSIQSQYVKELAEIAKRDRYLFTSFFNTVDYDALMAKIMPGEETPRLWLRTGFFERNLKEKPAWSSYQKYWLGR